MNLRYAILRHEGVPDPHFDLMFETAPGSAVATWRSPDWPPRPHTPFTPRPDHRPAYLTYEGPVSDNRGSVRRVAAGRYAIRENTDEFLVVTLDDGPTLRLPRVTSQQPAESTTGHPQIAQTDAY